MLNVGAPDEANRGFDAEVGAADQRSSPRRLGQRRRQLAKRSQGMRCQVCLPADYGRSERKIHSFQCCRRSGPPGRSGEQLLDSKLRGETDALGRSATADLLGSVHGRRLADELRSKERVLNGLVCTGFDDGGADRVGPGPMSIRLAPSCHAGPQFANNHSESPPHRADSLCQARLGSVGRRQHSLPEGFRLSGGPGRLKNTKSADKPSKDDPADEMLQKVLANPGSQRKAVARRRTRRAILQPRHEAGTEVRSD